MKNGKIIIGAIAAIVLFGILVVLAFNRFQQLKEKIENLQGQVTVLQDQIGIAGNVGKVEIREKTSSEEEAKDNLGILNPTWKIEPLTEIYSGALKTSLGELWVKNEKGEFYEYGSIPLSEYSAKVVIIKESDPVLESYVGSGFSTKIDIIKEVTANLEDKTYARIFYEITGVSLLDISTNSLGKIARDYEGFFDSTEVKKYYLCTGFMVKTLEYMKYNKLTGKASLNVPVINVNGSFYGESGKTEKKYELKRKLTPLSGVIMKVKDNGLEKHAVEVIENKLGKELTLEEYESYFFNSSQLKRQLARRSYKNQELIKIFERGSNLKKEIEHSRSDKKMPPL